MALNIEHKEENEGKNSRGRLSAEEFNNLIDTVKELEKNANTPSSIGELKNVSLNPIRQKTVPYYCTAIMDGLLLPECLFPPELRRTDLL